MKIIILIVVVLNILLVSSMARATCDDDYIREKSSDGAAITLSDDSVWEVDSSDRADSSLWMENDDVLACDDGYLINKSNGEKVAATKLN